MGAFASSRSSEISPKASAFRPRRGARPEVAVQRAKEELVSLVSQEMRSPLATIIGFADLLTTRDYSKTRRRHYLGIVLREGRRLAEVVDDFVELEHTRTDGSIQARAHRTPADVVLVDENHGFARVVQTEFAASGLITVWAPEPETADRRLDQAGARAVIVDLPQPGGQGKEFLIGLLASCGPTVPVVVTTKPLGQDGKEVLRQMGAMAVLGKHRNGVKAAATLLAGALKAPHSEGSSS